MRQMYRRCSVQWNSCTRVVYLYSNYVKMDLSFLIQIKVCGEGLLHTETHGGSGECYMLKRWNTLWSVPSLPLLLF